MPSTQAIVIAIAIATEGNVCIAQELGAMRRTQEDAVDDKKTTPKKRWGVDQISKLLHLARIPSKPNFPPMYTALAVGKGGSPRLHYPTECIGGLLLGSRDSNYFCSNCDIHHDLRHWCSSLCWLEH